MGLVQIMDCGKHDILPEAASELDLARVPVTMPRDSDADMRLDGSTTAQPVQNKPSMSADECTAHQALTPSSGASDVQMVGRAMAWNGAKTDRLEQRRRRWPRRGRRTRLRVQDKGSASQALLSLCLHILLVRDTISRQRDNLLRKREYRPFSAASRELEPLDNGPRRLSRPRRRSGVLS